MSTDPLLDARGWILDVDGCLMRTASAGGAGGAAMPHAANLLRDLQSGGREVLVVTNASQQTPATYAAHLRAEGIDVPDERFVTAGSAAADFIAAHHEGARVLVVGDVGLTEPLAAHGVELAESSKGARLADVVVVGAASSYATSVMNAACLAVDGGAPLYTTVETAWFHGGLGKSVAISAAVANAVGWATGVTPQVLGKPSAALAETLLHRLRLDPTQITVVGDAEAEIKLARAIGAHAALVLSGATTRQQLAELVGGDRPDLAIADVAELHSLLTDRLTTSQGART